MKRLIKAAFIAMSIVSAVAAPTAASAHGRPAHWHHHGGWHSGPAAAVGAMTGLALGSALAANTPLAYAVGLTPIYALPTVGGTCVTDSWREWVPGWGWQVHRRTVCH